MHANFSFHIDWFRHREEITKKRNSANLYSEGLNTVAEYSVLIMERKLLFTQFSVDV